MADLICPNCGSSSAVAITYGEPPAPPKVDERIGGCVVRPEVDGKTQARVWDGETRECIAVVRGSPVFTRAAAEAFARAWERGQAESRAELKRLTKEAAAALFTTEVAGELRFAWDARRQASAECLTALTRLANARLVLEMRAALVSNAAGASVEARHG